MPSPILSHASLFWSSLQIVDNDQVVLTSSTDYTVRLWSTRGEFIGGCHFVSINPLILDIINVHANNINLEYGAVLKVELLFMGLFNQCEGTHGWINPRGGPGVKMSCWAPVAPPFHSLFVQCVCALSSSSTHQVQCAHSSLIMFCPRASKQPTLLHQSITLPQVYSMSIKFKTQNHLGIWAMKIHYYPHPPKNYVCVCVKLWIWGVLHSRVLLQRNYFKWIQTLWHFKKLQFWLCHTHSAPCLYFW